MQYSDHIATRRSFHTALQISVQFDYNWIYVIESKSKVSIQIESDLKEILTKIDQKIDKLEEKFTQKLDTLSKDITELKVGQAEIKGEIKALEEKATGLDERVKNQEFVNRGVLVGLIVVILGGAAKLFGIVGNP